MAQMTWRLRVPELQLLEHWGPQGGSGKREHVCIGRETQKVGVGLEVRTREGRREKVPEKACQIQGQAPVQLPPRDPRVQVWAAGMGKEAITH